MKQLSKNNFVIRSMYVVKNIKHDKIGHDSHKV